MWLLHIECECKCNNTNESICSAAGGDLVSINDSIENAYVSNILTEHFWIGYTDELVEGSFVWVDGSTSSFTNWANNEPNSYSLRIMKIIL